MESVHMEDSLLERYMARIQQLEPQLAVERVQVNRDGLMNDVVIVNGELVFRFPKTDAARADLARELALLRLVGAHVDLRVPQIEIEAADVVMYRRIPGEPLYRHRLLRLREHEQASIAGQIGQFLGQLHALRSREASPQEDRRARYLTLLADVEQLIFPQLWADQRAWAADLFAPVVAGDLDLDQYTPALIHNDLASYHLLYDPASAQLTGVIDFGVAGEGDPAADYACLISAYGESLLRHMPVEAAVLDRARFLAGALELEWAVNGVRTGDTSWLLVHLGRARDALPWRAGQG
jgi:aminoglycoside 2''-phosphotransferase